MKMPNLIRAICHSARALAAPAIEPFRISGARPVEFSIFGALAAQVPVAAVIAEPASLAVSENDVGRHPVTSVRDLDEPVAAGARRRFARAVEHTRDLEAPLALGARVPDGHDPRLQNVRDHHRRPADRPASVATQDPTEAVALDRRGALVEVERLG